MENAMQHTPEYFSFRRARREDVPGIVRLLADDPLGAKRERYEDPLPQGYFDAFTAIDADPNQELIVACINGEVAGVIQLSFVPSLTHQGGWRATIESVRVDSRRRSEGLGRAMFRWALEHADGRRCRMVQLTTDKTRVRARRFYEGLGFVASHEGMKLQLGS